MIDVVVPPRCWVDAALPPLRKGIITLVGTRREQKEGQVEGDGERGERKGESEGKEEWGKDVRRREGKGVEHGEEEIVGRGEGGEGKVGMGQAGPDLEEQNLKQFAEAADFHSHALRHSRESVPP